jgi:hypothetical protein
MILEGMAWLGSAIGLVGLYKWFKIRYYMCVCKTCKCAKCKKRENN